MEKESVNSTVKSYDGVQLYTIKDVISDPRAVILIVHGLAEHLGRYDYVVDRLNSFGYTVYRYDNRGHGKSEGQRCYLDDFNEFFDDANFMVDLVKRENPGLPVYLLGHSMGGFVVTGFGAKYPAKVNGIILTDAATADRAGILNTIPLALPPTTMLPNNLSQLICSDPAVVKAYEEDPLVAKEISVGLFKQIQEGINWLHAEGHIKDFAYPCLILHGGADQIVSPEDSKFLYESISSTDKEIKIYDGLFHEILNEKTRDNVLADINNWISERLA